MKYPAASDVQDAINRRVYHDKAVVREYAGRTLNLAEGLTLLRHQSAFAGRDVLDLGVGTGRTAVYLAPLARHYMGIDYSPVMVAAMRESMPDVPVMECDVRDLSAFEDGQFDFVFGSNCVLDALPPEGRDQALSELHRVLRPDGTLAFTSHNRHVRLAQRTPHVAWSRNPVNSALQVLRWGRKVWNRSRVRPLHQEAADYALYCDEGHDYACLHYYISQASQREQLARHGFSLVEVIDTHGHMPPPEAQASDSSWLMYIARRLPHAAQAELGRAA